MLEVSSNRSLNSSYAKEDLGRRVHWFPISIGSYLLTAIATSLSPIQTVYGMQIGMVGIAFTFLTLSWIRLSMWLFR